MSYSPEGCCLIEKLGKKQSHRKQGREHVAGPLSAVMGVITGGREQKV
jgi:hypothetical protein